MRLLQNLVTFQAERQPEATALVLKQERITYGQLEETSNQLAGILKEAGCKKGDRICFLMPKSPTAIVTILGILKADCVYVPLDPAGPASRLARVVRACEPRWILGAGPVVKLLDELMQEKFETPSAIGWLDPEPAVGTNFKPEFSRTDLQAYPTQALDYQHKPEDMAYIFFTSGSTGIPKGVVITHANVIHFVEWANKYFGVSSTDKNSGHSPLHFDLSTYDVFGTLAAGAQLHLVPPELNLLPHKLAQFIRESELTQWFSVPSILNYMARLDVVQDNDFPALTRLLWCGEVFPTPALMYWMQKLPHVTFTNLYGPTEATIASSYYTIPECPKDGRESIPIGTACDGEALLVLDDNLQAVPPSEIGDLYIAGVGLSTGYWNDLEKTQAVFRQYRSASGVNESVYKTGDLARLGEDGLVYFHGRADFQIKSRGYRIELGEIETAMTVLDSLQECAVVAIDVGGFEGSTICCAYVPSPGFEVTPAGLRQELSAALPSYMLPTRWQVYEELPKNVNGKIDRRKLKEEFEQQAG